MKNSFDTIEMVVLFVSYSQTLRQRFQSQMGDTKAVVHLAETPSQALKMASDHGVTMVVIDLAATEDNDGQSITLIKMLQPLLPNIGFVLVSASQDNDNILSDLPAHMPIQLLAKTYSQSKLIETITVAVDLYQQRIIRLRQEEQVILTAKVKALKLLFLEDNPADADLIRECWAEWRPGTDCTLTHCETVADALALLATDQFSLVLTDLNVPDSQGLETVSSLLAATDAPIIVLTDDLNEDRSMVAISLGIQDYLSKSGLDSAHLRRSVHYAIERERVHKEYRKLLEQNPDGIVVVDEMGMVLFANAAAGNLFDCEVKSLLGEQFGCPIEGRDKVEMQSRAGHHLEMNLVETDWKGRSAQIVSLRDITLHKQLQEQLAFNANHDPLTGLANRTLLGERLSHAIMNAKRSATKVAVLMLDLDRFKLINDTMGHDVGDSLLRATAARLQATLRKTDTLARVGGDEFVIVMEHHDNNESVVYLAGKILSRMEEPFVLSGKSFIITTSIGIACCPKDGEDAASLLKNADVAMYRSKEVGRNCFHLYDAQSHRQSMQQLSLESELNYALQGNQFVLHYQPQHSLTGLKSIEALLRWQHPGKGLLPPDSFIPLLEKTGLIREVEKWILKTSLSQLKLWHKVDPDLRMSINISAQTLQTTDLPKQIKQQLKACEISPEHLEIEITESMLIDNTSIARQVLDELNKMGVGIAMDDFGTGYSSLSYLLDFPAFTTLKIDRSFTTKLETDDRARSVLGIVMSLAHVLKMAVVAEGVETTGQMTLLKDHNCDLYQGYLFSKALPAKKFGDYLSNASG